MFAIIETGGKQYKVEIGKVLSVEKLPNESGTAVFDKVLLVANGENIEIGAPYLQGVSVEADIVATGRGKKKIVFHYRRKKRSPRARGTHRQPFTKVKITAIKMKEK